MGKKKKTWWVGFFETSVQIERLGYLQRGVIYSWLLSLEGVPVARKMLFNVLLGEHDSRGDKKKLTELIDKMVDDGLIVECYDGRISLPTWLVDHVIDNGGGVSKTLPDCYRASREIFLGLNSPKSNTEKNTGEVEEKIRGGNERETELIKNERERDQESEHDSLSVPSNSVSSLATISGASQTDVLSVVLESDRLYAISYPSSAPDRTSGYKAIRQKVKALIEEHGLREVEKRVRAAYSQGLKWVEDEGENVTLAAIVNGFQYITEKKKSTAQPKGRMVIKAGTYEPTEDSFPGLKFDPEIAAAGLQERQNGG